MFRNLKCQSTHAMDIEVMDTPPLKIYPIITVPLAIVASCMILISQLFWKFSSLSELPLVVRIIWKSPSSSEQGPSLEARSAGNWSPVSVTEYEALHGAVSCYGCRCIAEMTCWWPGGEEALSAFTAEDRSVAKTRRRTGMLHIPQCWKQSEVGEWEENQISMKRCQQ